MEPLPGTVYNICPWIHLRTCQPQHPTKEAPLHPFTRDSKPRTRPGTRTYTAERGALGAGSHLDLDLAFTLVS